MSEMPSPESDSEQPGDSVKLGADAASEAIPSVRSGDIPAATASRLGLYLRELQHFLRGGTETIKSNALGRRLGLSDSQIRRDLALFGEFGKRGVGYNVSGLVQALRRALGTDGNWNTILIGLGNLGTALVRYRGFREQGFRLQAIFESDATKIGTELDGIPIYGIDDLEQIVPRLNAQMAILAVPVGPAPALARRLADLGIAGILNFAPVSLALHDEVSTVDVDLAVELQRLAFAVVNSDRSS
ncbi:MAG: redox-sensing transcriptional repressor Rex [bacterium]|nr:redox-sensing transcriptional repressor Rex [bacterium]